MNFCKKCNNLLDITNKINKEQTKIINDPNILIDLVDNDELNNITNCSFILEDLKKVLIKRKIKNKEKIIDIYNNLINFKKLYLICKKCGYFDIMKSKNIIYSKVIKSSNILNSNLRDIFNDKTYPRTKDYICVNKDCKSHTNLLDKEAIFYRPILNNYKTKYICGLCYTSWDT